MLISSYTHTIVLCSMQNLRSPIRYIMIRFGFCFVYCSVRLKTNKSVYRNWFVSICMTVVFSLFCFPLSTIPISIEGVHMDWNFKLKTQNTTNAPPKTMHMRKVKEKREREEGKRNSNQLYILLNFNLDYMIESRFYVAAELCGVKFQYQKRFD